MKFCKVLLNGNVQFDKARIMSSFFERLVGLMFQKNPSCKALVFKDSGWIHSFFCFIPFNAIFIGKNGKILNHFVNIKQNKILPPVFGTKYTIEYLGAPLSISKDDRIEIELCQKKTFQNLCSSK